MPYFCILSKNRNTQRWAGLLRLFQALLVKEWTRPLSEMHIITLKPYPTMPTISRVFCVDTILPILTGICAKKDVFHYRVSHLKLH